MQLYAEAMQPGWNLGNTLDAAGAETSWGNPETTKEIIDQIASQGFKSIRIPITWNHRLSSDYTINPAFMDRVQEIVDWSLDAGLYVMINLHHDSHWIMPMENNREQVMAKFTAIWEQVAERFKDYNEKLSFEGINEPRFSEDWGEDKPIYFEMVDELNSTFHQIVRSSGGGNKQRPLVLGSVTTAHSQNRLNELAKTIEKLNDQRLIATIHYYGFYPFSVNLGGGTTFDEQAKRDVIDSFDRAYNTFVTKGIPVIIGEFGLLGFDKYVETIQQGEKLKYFEFVNNYAQEKGMVTMLWDNGQHFNRRELRWNDDALYEVMKASWSGRSASAERDFIYLRQGAPIEDVAMPLHLYGHTLVELRNGDTPLVRGFGYELDGDTLIFKSSMLKSLLTGELGVNATLTVSFSGGANWTIDIIAYETPQLEHKDGMTSGYAIPTRFGGDRLATMEATYAAGGNAGPQNWTPFKEYGASFSPEYEFGAIKLTNDFFKEVGDGEIKLKFHFWSGEVIDYTLKKEGLSIIGLSSQQPVQEVAPEEEPAAGDSGSPDGSAETTGTEDSGEAAAEAADEATAKVQSGALLLGFGAVALAALAAAGMIVYRRKKAKL